MTRPTSGKARCRSFKLGGFDLAKLPGLQGIPMTEMQQAVDIELAGVVGAELLSLFRVTFADEGRFVWMEPDPMLVSQPGRAPAGPPAGPPQGPPPPPQGPPPPDPTPAPSSKPLPNSPPSSMGPGGLR